MTPRSSPRAFTIVEMLVSISIVALLLAILLPALSSARDTARATNEVAACRELMVAWTLYAQDHDDDVLPGYKSGLPAYDRSGNEISQATAPVVAARYPWRIAPYLDYSLRGLYKNDLERVLEELEQTSTENFDYLVSLSPSLGINATWVGGDESELGFNRTAIKRYGNFYVWNLSQVIHPQRLFVFASARGLDTVDEEAGPIEGYFRVRSPRLNVIEGRRWADEWRRGMPPADYGHVSLRWNTTAVAGFVDGHVDRLGERQMNDMRYWANRARTRDYALDPASAP